MREADARIYRVQVAEVERAFASDQSFGGHDVGNTADAVEMQLRIPGVEREPGQTCPGAIHRIAAAARGVRRERHGVVLVVRVSHRRHLQISRAVLNAAVESVIVAWRHRRERPVRAADLTADLNRQRLPRAETYAEIAGVQYVGLPVSYTHL